MALQLSLSSLSLRSPSFASLCPNLSLSFSNNSLRLCNTSRNRCFRFLESKEIRRKVDAKCGGSNLDAVGFVLGQVTEVNKDTFWPIVKEAGEKIVVLDMYTQWCGPCKVIAPKVQELSEKYLDVVFLKLDCNQENKPLAKELGVRVVPTFKILKDSKIVKEITGAKFDDLLREIDIYRSST